MRQFLVYSLAFTLFLSFSAEARKKSKTDEPKWDKYLEYDITLVAVERPANAKESYGDVVVTPTEEQGIKKYRFEDGMISTLWIFSPVGIASFTLQNKTDHSVKIVWDESALVDADGVTHRVSHSGVRYSEVNSPQPPTVVPKGGSVEDQVLPSDGAKYSTLLREWVHVPLLPTGFTRDVIPKLEEALRKAEAGEDMGTSAPEQPLIERGKKFVGKRFRLLLALQIEGTVNEYTFVFEVGSVIERAKSPEDMRKEVKFQKFIGRRLYEEVSGK